MSDYPEQHFPWTFYFNGVAMPRWGAQWPLFTDESHSNWDWEVGPRDYYIVRCLIDHVGVIESTSPHVFLYAVQELMCLLFTERERVMQNLYSTLRQHAEPEEVYNGLVNAAFEMRAMVYHDGLAFWTSGYEEDRLQLVEAMRCASLAPNDPEHLAPPHVRRRLSHLDQLWRTQVKILHSAAASGTLPKDIRKKLLEL